MSVYDAVKTVRAASLFAFAVAASFFTTNAQACSDLPNVCAENGEFDKLQTPVTGKARDAEETTPQRSTWGTTNPIISTMAGIILVRQTSRLSNADIAQRKKDPVFKAALLQYQNGGWRYFQDSQDLKPAEYCSALFSKGDTLVRISGPGGGYAGALMTFSSPSIPSADKVRKRKVTLKQSDGSSQTVQAFHYQLSGEPLASIVFAVPTIQLALAEMKVSQGFDVFLENRSVAKITWNKGLKARRALEKCLAGT